VDDPGPCQWLDDWSCSFAVTFLDIFAEMKGEACCIREAALSVFMVEIDLPYLLRVGTAWLEP